MIESKVQKQIKLQAIANTKLLPREGEQLDIRGGLGNAMLKQLKNENGVIYERKDSTDNWKKVDMIELLNRLQMV